MQCEREHGQRSVFRCWLYPWSFMMANLGVLCPKPDSRTLLNHVTTHSSGENLYKYGQCRKIFEQAGSLNDHKLTQSGEKSPGVSILRYFSRTLLIIYSHFYKKLGPIYKKLNCETMVTDHRPERTTMHLRTTYNALKRHLSACTL